jgi:radical SAM protein with 4Fe4S-binding SPASM domain
MFSSILSRFTSASRLKPGLYTFRGKDGRKGLSVQLRIETDGKGILAINANAVLYLNETATLHAYLFVKGSTIEETVNTLTKIYKVSKEDARKDYEHLVYTINTIASTEKICPISYLGVNRLEPFSTISKAPVRMDFALTFRCQNDCLHCYTGGPKETPELSTPDWIKVIKRVKEQSIFVVTFTGGEPTLREDLPQLLQFAQDSGLVTGLVTNGRRLSDTKYIHSLEKAGLDFAQITVESYIPQVHDRMTCSTGSWEETIQGLVNTLSSEIYVSTNTTLTTLNADSALETMTFLKSIGVKNFCCNSLIYSGRGISSESIALPIEKLKKILQELEEKADQLGMTFTWFTPTRYCELDPTSMGLGLKSCSAALLNMCVAPNGDVYPCQSYFKPVGNILRDKWESIWNNPLCVDLRERKFAPPECKDCTDFKTCGSGCPLEYGGDQYLCQEL